MEELTASGARYRYQNQLSWSKESCRHPSVSSQPHDLPCNGGRKLEYTSSTVFLCLKDASIPQDFCCLSVVNLQETNSIYFENLVANLHRSEQGRKKHS